MCIQCHCVATYMHNEYNDAEVRKWKNILSTFCYHIMYTYKTREMHGLAHQHIRDNIKSVGPFAMIYNTIKVL